MFIEQKIESPVKAWVGEYSELKKKLHARDAARNKRDHYVKKLATLHRQKSQAQMRSEVLPQQFHDRLKRNDCKSADALHAFQVLDAEVFAELKRFWDGRESFLMELMHSTLQMETLFHSRSGQHIETIEQVVSKAALGEPVEVNFAWKDMVEIGQAQAKKLAHQKHKKRFIFF
jgi:hypothetical protein